MVNYEGPTTAEIAFIGEAPGADEVTEGRPFIGRAGQRLMNLINQAGLCREDVLLANVSRHRPPGNKFSHFWVDKKQTVPTTLLVGEVQFLKNTLLNMPNLKMIICLGRHPTYLLTGLAEVITGKESQGIMKYRGTVISQTIKTFPNHIRLGAIAELNNGIPKKVNTLMTLHPSFLLRNPAYNIVVLMDIKKAVRNVNTKKLLPDRKMVVYPTKEDWEFFYHRALASSNPLSTDIETRGGRITRLGLCVDEEYAISIPFININTQQKYPNEYIWPGFHNLLQKKEVLGQNFLSYDIFWLENYGCHFPNFIFDTKIAQHCILPGLPKMLKPLSLTFLGSIYTNEPYYKDEAKEQDKKPPEDKVYGEYNCKDVLTTLAVYLKQITHPLFKASINIFNFETKLARTVLYDITNTGIFLNEPYRQELKERAERECEYLSLKLAEKAGRHINLASPQQLAKLLYTDLKLKTQYNSVIKDGRKNKVVTTDELALKKLKGVYSKYHIQELDWILKFRTVDQLRKGILSTRIDPDNRIRCTVTQTTDSGRLASTSSPFWTGQSLHVIPTEKKIRKTFIPDNDVWVYRDLSQAEAWATYYYAGARGMLERMERGEKPHQMMASIIGRKGYKNSGKGTEEYELGKRVVHARNYLIGPKTLADIILKELGLYITMSQAKKYLQLYDKLVPELHIWHLSLLTELKQNGMKLKNAFGRERKFYGFFDGTLNGSIKVLQQAASYKPQSTIGDLLDNILLNWYDIRTVGKLIMPVHDETNTQCSWEELGVHRSELDKAFNYPITVGNYKDVIIPWETKIMKNWGEEYTEDEIQSKKGI